MKKKYYYDCPIKALYMMKEFGVNLKCENESSSYYYSFGKAMLDHIRREVLKDTTWEKNLGKIYVAPESEHIFEPKVKDYGLDSQEYLVAHNGVNWGSPHNVRIIIREGKHFFNPKEEN